MRLRDASDDVALHHYKYQSTYKNVFNIHLFISHFIHLTHFSNQFMVVLKWINLMCIQNIEIELQLQNAFVLFIFMTYCVNKLR